MGEPRLTSRYDLDLRPMPRRDIETVQISAELVVLDGWRAATVLSPPGAAAWKLLDGRASLRSIAEDLSEEFGVDLRTIAADVVDLTRRLALLGLIDGVDVGSDETAPDITVTPAHVISDAGETIEDLELFDVAGEPTRLLDLDANGLLLVNWSPHCGYCTSIVPVLARLEAPLAAAGVSLTLFASGSAEASQTLADLSGWHPRTLLNPPQDLGLRQG